MAKQEIYKTHPLVFYQNDKELYEQIKKVSKSKRMNLRGYILLAVETFLKEENIGGIGNELNSVNINREVTPVASDGGSHSNRESWGNW